MECQCQSPILARLGASLCRCGVWRSGGPDRQTDIQDRSANNAMGAIVILRHTVYEAATTDAKEGMSCPSVANIANPRSYRGIYGELQVSSRKTRETKRGRLPITYWHRLQYLLVMFDVILVTMRGLQTSVFSAPFANSIMEASRAPPLKNHIFVGMLYFNLIFIRLMPMSVVLRLAEKQLLLQKN